MSETKILNSKKIKIIWNDPVWSKVIAGFILLIPALISSIIAKTSRYSFRDFFFQTITITIYQLIIIITIIILFAIILRWYFKKKIKPSNTNVSNLFKKEYEIFKSDETFKYFDQISSSANSRLHFGKFDQNLVNYYVAKGILYDPNPGYGIYVLTRKGTDFFNRRSIEKINEIKLNGS